MNPKERIIVFTHDTSVQTECSKNWSVDVKDRSPMEELAFASLDDQERSESVDKDLFRFKCKQHGNKFAVWEGCNDAVAHYKAGETVSLPADKAEWYVKYDRASYPTHKPIIEESVQSTINRTNALMDSMGFPHIDPDAIKAISATRRGTSKHYRKPADIRLANELGLGADDIAEMRKAGRLGPS